MVRLIGNTAALVLRHREDSDRWRCHLRRHWDAITTVLKRDRMEFVLRSTCRIGRASMATTAFGLAVVGTVWAIGPAQAAPSAQDQVTELTATLQAAQQHSEALSQAYDQATSDEHVAASRAQAAKMRVAALQRRIAATSAKLRSDALNAYISGSGASTEIAIFSSSLDSQASRAQYVAAAVGNLQRTEITLARERGAARRARVNADASAAQAAANAEQASTLATRNQQLAASVTSQLTAAKAEVAQEAQAALAAQEAAAQQAAAQHDQQSGGSTGPVGGSSRGSGSGLQALNAAITQIGVPYVWGGESPGHGFDCSGLTQWAWAQAGVSIPRTAAGQWAGLPHVSLDSLQPGDLLLYNNLDGDHVVDHVVMFAGSGPYGTSTIIAASHTGAPIGYGPLFTTDLIGAVRP